ncbi:uncharacterized protein LOC122809569 [Protopterus annectens]|uniref:uncharacterized protein LOC122809569 n=1 Tax=Protopterus annectens TaxID=7888 RepID=UPI001CFBFCD2|nr:uncharacterized protein LOC122809569 [Protopterus annectens]
MSVTFAGWGTFLDGKRKLRHGQEPKRDNSYTMFHGSHINNAKAIIQNGFKPSADGLLGAGVYISRNISKAMNYPLNASDDVRVVFKLKVRVGTVKKINTDNHPLQKTWHQHGYDTAWVPPNSNISSIRSGREEDCVWDPKRITVIDIAYCKANETKQCLRQLIKHQANGDARAKGSMGYCQVCENDTKVFHPVGKCWECQKVICPFMTKHICKKKKNIQH